MNLHELITKKKQLCDTIRKRKIELEEELEKMHVELTALEREAGNKRHAIKILRIDLEEAMRAVEFLKNPVLQELD